MLGIHIFPLPIPLILSPFPLFPHCRFPFSPITLFPC
jgi:hypothetical protein